MIDRKGLHTSFFLTLLISLLLLGCEKKEVHSYERPLFAIENTLKDEYLGLFFQNKKMGYFHGSAYTVSVQGKNAFYLSGDALIKIEAEGEKLFTVLKEEILLDESFKTIYFNYSQKIGESVLNIIAKKQNNNYAVKTFSSGRAEETVIKEEFLPLAAAGFIVWKNGISEGKDYTFNVFVEALQKVEQLKIVIGKKQFENGNVIYPLHQKLGNIEITSYVLQNGDTYKEESIQGFTMKMINKEEALKIDTDTVSFYDLFSFSLIPVDTDLDRDFKQLTILVSGFDKKVEIKNSNYQKAEKVEDGYKITVSKDILNKLETNIDFKPYLTNSLKIQKDAPEIKELANTITKNALTDKEKTELIVKWVNKNIKKRLKDKVSALDVLSSKEGECEAHSMLVAALLRSINIPTKIVGGIVYSKEFKGFLYHAWNEVWIDGVFLPIDATFGEFPAKPYHIKLTEENNMEDVVFFLGKLKVKIVSIL